MHKPNVGLREIDWFFKGHFKKTISSLENFFATYMQSKYCIFTSSCRCGLFASYYSLGIKGEVLVSPLVCSSAILPIVCAGLTPKFVDIDKDTFNINPDDINESISKKTVAIQAIHLAGNPCDMRPIVEIAKDNNLFIVEDCAQSLGSEYYGKKVGTFGDIACFSPIKSIYGIGGGLVVTDSFEIMTKIRNFNERLQKHNLLINYYRLIRDLFERNNVLNDLLIRSKSTFGFTEEFEDCNFLKSDRFFYKPSNVEATVLLSQMKTLKSQINKNLENVDLLNKKLIDIKNIKLQKIMKNSKSVYSKYMFTSKYNAIDLINKFWKLGIEAKHLSNSHGVEFQERFDRDPLFSGYDSINNCRTYLSLHDNIISLPISPILREHELLYIYNQMKTVIR